MRLAKSLAGFVIGILLIFGGLSGGICMAQSNDDDTIRNLVEVLFHSYQQKDIEGVSALLSKKSSSFAENKQFLRDELASFEKLVVNDFEIRRPEKNSEQAILRVMADVSITGAYLANPLEKIEKQDWTIDLVKEDGVWKVTKFIRSEAELAKAIIAANTELERQALMEKEPELVTTYLAQSLIRQNYIPSSRQADYQLALAATWAAFDLFKMGKKPEEITPELVGQHMQQIQRCFRGSGQFSTGFVLLPTRSWSCGESPADGVPIYYDLSARRNDNHR